MKEASAVTRRRLEMQGYVGLSDEQICEVGGWLRFAPAVCAIVVAAATYFASATTFFVLVPFALLGALLPVHPFELVYNHGIRHLLGKASLPPAKAPRRFACGIASIWLAATGWAFLSGAATLGAVLGWLFTVTAAIPATTDFCVPSFIWGKLFGPPAGASAE